MRAEEEAVVRPNPAVSVDGLTVVITGAGRGNGKGIAVGLARAGARVQAFDIAFPEPEVLEAESVRCFEGDVTDAPRFREVCAVIHQDCGTIDGLINNAGVTLPRSAKEPYPLESWQQTLDVNLTAPFLCCQAVFPVMCEKGRGSIVNVTSLNAELGFPGNPAYAASKGGLRMLSKALARDWGRFGIRVNNLGPGYMITDMTRRSYEDEKSRRAREASTMLGRWGAPEDLVGACAFLLSEGSAYVTGQDLYVDGGWSANGLVDD